MPRQARLDAPNTLHHVMVRGIERTTIFRDDRDRADFVARLGGLVAQGALTVPHYRDLSSPYHGFRRAGSERPALRLQKNSS